MACVNNLRRLDILFLVFLLVVGKLKQRESSIPPPPFSAAACCCVDDGGGDNDNCSAVVVDSMEASISRSTDGDGKREIFSFWGRRRWWCVGV